MIQGIIYKWTNLKNNKSYIGKTTREKKRYYEHLKDRRKDLPFHRALDKYGVDNFKYEVIFKTSSNSIDNLNVILSTLEKHYIKKFKSNDKKFGYNLTEGGDGASGIIRSAVTREKIRKARLGKPHPHLGHPNSLESREKMRKAKIGYKPTHSYKPVLMLDLKGNLLMEFKSIMDARLYVDKGNITGGSKHIGSVCKGERNQCKGYKWKYK